MFKLANFALKSLPLALLLSAAAPSFAYGDSLALGPAPMGCPVPAQALGLQSVVELALCHQASLREGSAALAQARAGLLLQESTLWPQVGLSASWEQARRDGLSAQARGSSTSATLSASQVLFDFGRRSADVASARALVQAAGQDLDALQQAVALEAARRYFEVGSALFRERSVAARVESAARAARQATAQLEQGVAVRLDVLQANAEHAQARLELTRARATLSLARTVMGQYLGVADAQSIALPPAEAFDIEPGALPQSLDALLEEALSRNPRVQAARARVVGAEQSLSASRSAEKPVFRAGASLGASRQGGVSSDNSRLTLTMEVPLFDGGAARARIAQAAAARDRLVAAQDSAVQALAESVARSRLELLQADESASVAGEFVVAAEAALAQAQGQYAAGAATVADVLRAQASQVSAQESLNSARVAWRTAQLALASAVGSLNPAAL
jgi:outer membrane protein